MKKRIDFLMKIHYHKGNVHGHEKEKEKLTKKKRKRFGRDMPGPNRKPQPKERKGGAACFT